MKEPKSDLSTSPRAIWNLLWPQLIMMSVLFIMNFTDVWTAGKINGSVQAALGIASQGYLFLQVLSMAVSAGALACISQALGAQKSRRACLYVSSSLAGASLLGLFIGAVALIFSGLFLKLLFVPEGIAGITESMWDIYMIALPGAYLHGTSGALFRATRQVIPPLWVGCAACIANIFGNLGFGLGSFGLPACGYEGIAWTTCACTWLSALANCLLLARSGFLRRDRLPCLRWVKKSAPYLLQVAANAGGAHLLWNMGFLVLYIVVASLPNDSVNALAGMTAGLRVEALLFLPAMAANMTASVVIGNLIGAQDYGGAKKLGLQITAFGVGAMTLVSLCLWFVRQDLAELVAGDAAVIAQTVCYLEYNIASTPFSVASTIMSGIMTGAGATRFNMIVYGSAVWLLRLPLAFLLGHYIWGQASGVFAAMLFSQIIQSAVMFGVLIHGAWLNCGMKKNSSAAA